MLTILGVIIPVAYGFMSQSLGIFTKELINSQDRSDIQYIITELKDEIRKAKVVEAYEGGILIDGEYFGMFGGMYKSRGVTISGIKDVEFTDVNDRSVTFVVRSADYEVVQLVGLYKPLMKLNDGDKDLEPVENMIGMYSNKVSITGSSRVVADGQTVIINESLLNGSANVNYIAADNIYVGGSINLPNSSLGNGNGTVYVVGSLTLSGSGVNVPRIIGNIELGGKIHNNITGGDLSVLVTGEYKEEVEVLIPEVNMPQLNTDFWYESNGFSNLVGALRFRGGSIAFGSIQEDQEYLVVSDGDVRLNYWQHMKGIIFAPNGRVEIGGSAQFTGVIVADSIDISGNAVVTLLDKSLGDVGVVVE